MTKRQHRVRAHTRKTKHGKTTVKSHTRGMGDRKVEPRMRNLEQVKRWEEHKMVGGEKFHFWGVYQTHSAARKEKESISSFAKGSIVSSPTDMWHPKKGGAVVKGRGGFALYTKHKKKP